MSKISNNPPPSREVYNALQRVLGSNRFIFTQFPIAMAIGIVLGAIPLLVYGYAGLGFLCIALGFEGPYQYLRKFFPYGNWPPHLVGNLRRRKITSITLLIFLVLQFLGILWSVHQLIDPSSTWTDFACNGSLSCLFFRRWLS